jgi:DNA-binding LacI/PurR family transcriptional regulator
MSQTTPSLRVSRERIRIAEVAQISVHTVNAYFSPRARRRVAALTRARIQEAADRLTYRPASSPVEIERGAQKTVGYQIPRTWDINKVDNVVFARLFAALLQEAERHGLALRTFGGEPIAAADIRSPRANRRLSHNAVVHEIERAYSTGAIDGFVFDDPSIDDPRLLHAQASGIPYVVAGNPVEIDPATRLLRRPRLAARWPCVNVDDESGFRDLVTILSKVRGHDRLMHVAFEADDTFPGIRRAYGIVTQARSLGIPTPVPVWLDYNAPPSKAVEIITAALNQHPEVTGVLCDCDRYVFHTQLAAQRLGRRVAVAGCDDDQFRRAWPRPWLSLTNAPSQRGRETIAALLNRMNAASATSDSEETYYVRPTIVGLTKDDLERIARLNLPLNNPFDEASD